MKNWKIACSSAPEAPETAPILLKGSIEDNLRQAARIGYQAIEVHLRETSKLDLPAIQAIMDEHQVRVCMLVTGRLNTEGKVNLIDDDPAITRAALIGMKQYIDLAQSLGADIIVGWVKGNIPVKGDRALYLDRLANHLRELAAYAKARQVRINIEVINRYEVNLFKTCQELVEFLDANQLDNCFVHLDTFHMNIEENDPVAAIRLAGDRLGYFHLADNTRRYPGIGQIDFSKQLRALQEINYQGYLSIECLPDPSGEEAAARGLAFIQRTIAAL